MPLLGARKRRKIKHLGQLGLSDPLAVTPEAEQGVDARIDEQNLLQLRRRFTTRGGIYGWISRKLRYRHEVRINLDERGTRFWQLMDGRRSLDAIAAALGREFDLEQSKAREAAILFTKMLMTRHLVYLRVPTVQDE
jgi:hypothetical protein